MDEESPGLRKLLIAIAIMIVVVVVLGLALYVMVIPSPWHSHDYTPAGAFLEVEADSSTEAHIVFALFTEDVRPTDIEVYFWANGNRIGHLSWTNAATVQWLNGTATVSASYFDINPDGKPIDSGDYLTLTGLEPGTVYEIDVFYLPTRTVVTMTGVEPVFTTLP